MTPQEICSFFGKSLDWLDKQSEEWQKKALCIDDSEPIKLHFLGYEVNLTSEKETTV